MSTAPFSPCWLPVGETIAGLSQAGRSLFRCVRLSRRACDDERSAALRRAVQSRPLSLPRDALLAAATQALQAHTLYLLLYDCCLCTPHHSRAERSGVSPYPTSRRAGKSPLTRYTRARCGWVADAHMHTHPVPLFLLDCSPSLPLPPSSPRACVGWVLRVAAWLEEQATIH